ncbi:hypothetical protein TRVL_00145 [Trypanosoma vivax]|nr:hypothetical protein TRVL_00145 [Trypanosoma vivax]
MVSKGTHTATVPTNDRYFHLAETAVGNAKPLCKLLGRTLTPREGATLGSAANRKKASTNPQKHLVPSVREQGHSGTAETTACQALTCCKNKAIYEENKNKVAETTQKSKSWNQHL